MALAFVQKIGDNSSSSGGTTLAITVPAGGVAQDSLIVIAAGGSSSAVISSVADSKGNTYQVDDTEATYGFAGSVATAIAATALVSGDTITITYSASVTFRTACAYEFSGAATASWLDKVVSAGDASGTSSAPDSGLTATTAQADELIFAAFTFLTVTISAEGSGYSALGGRGGGGGRQVDAAYKIVSSTGTYKADCTLSGNSNWNAICVTIKAAAAGQTISLGGTVTPAGALARLAGKGVAGSITPAGALARLVAKATAGTITPAGLLSKLTGKSVAGTVTPAGGLTLDQIKAILLAGTITPAGALTKLTAKALAGTITPSGLLSKLTGKGIAGTVTPEGGLSRLTGKGFGGTITPAGALSRLVAKALTGTITPAGLLTLPAAAKTILVGGVITPVGTLTRKASKGLVGTLSMVGTLAFRAAGYNFGAFHDKKSRSMNVREIRGTSHKGHR